PKELDQKITPYIPARGKVKSNGLAHRMFSLFDKENHWQRITLNAHIAEAVTEVCEAAGRVETGLNGLDVVPPHFGDAVGQGLLCASEQWLSAESAIDGVAPHSLHAFGDTGVGVEVPRLELFQREMGRDAQEPEHFDHDVFSFILRPSVRLRKSLEEKQGSRRIESSQPQCENKCHEFQPARLRLGFPIAKRRMPWHMTF